MFACLPARSGKGEGEVWLRVKKKEREGEMRRDVCMYMTISVAGVVFSTCGAVVDDLLLCSWPSPCEAGSVYI